MKPLIIALILAFTAPMICSDKDHDMEECPSMLMCPSGYDMMVEDRGYNQWHIWCDSPVARGHEEEEEK
jgi:hypothetical protein